MAKGAKLSKLLIYIDTGFSFRNKRQSKIYSKIAKFLQKYRVNQQKWTVLDKKQA